MSTVLVYVSLPTAADFVHAHGCPTGCNTYGAFNAGIQSDDMAAAVIKHWATRDFTFDVWNCIAKYSARQAYRDIITWNENPSTSHMATYTRWSRDYHTIIATHAKQMMMDLIDVDTLNEKAKRAAQTKDTVTFLHTSPVEWSKWAEGKGVHPNVAAYLANASKLDFDTSLMQQYEELGGFTYNRDKDKKFFELYYRLHGRVHACVLEYITMCNTLKREHLVETAHAIHLMFPGMLK